MNDLFSIGEFSRTTHLSVKALRHYHDVGVLEPAAVDPATGYRCYSVAQVPAAQVVRQLRDLDMPLDDVRAVLDASARGDADTRDRIIVEHLGRMEAQLAQTQASISSLRSLLEGEPCELVVEHRTVPAMRALALREHIAWDNAEGWLSEAFDALHAAVPVAARLGPDAALYSGGFFEAHFGEVIACITVNDVVPAPDDLQLVEISAATLAVTVHEGPFDELDRTYAALGSYVAARAIGAPGPIRERYLVADADDPAELRTEVGWPIVAVPDVGSDGSPAAAGASSDRRGCPG